MRKMLLICLIIGCLFGNLSAQNQAVFRNPLSEPSSIYFPENWAQESPLGQVQPVKPLSHTAVEVEKSNEVAYTTTVDQLINRYNPQRTTPKQILQRNPSVPLQSDYKPAVNSNPAPLNNEGYNFLLYPVTNFGINLIKSVNAAGNVIISPFSIASVLALLQQGSLGQTQEQINTALQMSPDASARAFGVVTNDINNREQSNILKTANNVFVARTFTLNPDFKRSAQRNFDSAVTPVSFGEPEVLANDINTWVASKTNNKILNLIAPDSLGPTTQVVLVNAIYFKGLWETPFKKDSTRDHEFSLSNGQKKIASFMRMRNYFTSGMDRSTNARVIIMPFEQKQYSLMIILPSQLVGITETLNTLTDARLVSYHNFDTLDVDLQLPKFTIKSDIDLASVLRNMGVSKIFSDQAELSGLGSYQSQSPRISSAVHSAVLSIDENGGSAAAATAFAAVALSYEEPPSRFIVDRPFIAVLWDNKSSLPLFIAKVENPQA